jgi:hypothetical protein
MSMMANMVQATRSPAAIFTGSGRDEIVEELFITLLRPNETQGQPPLRRRSFAAHFSVEVIRKLNVGTAGGWLERMVRSLRDNLI